MADRSPRRSPSAPRPLARPHRHLPVVLALAAGACGRLPLALVPRADVAGILLAPAPPSIQTRSLLAQLPLPGLARTGGLVGHNSAGLRGIQGIDAATASTVPVVRAPVLALDGAGKAFPGTGAFSGDGGAFMLRGVPAGRPVLVSAAYAIDDAPQVQLALVAPEAGDAPITLDPAMSAATARALAAAGGRLDAIDPDRVHGAAETLRREGATFSQADLASAEALAGAFERAGRASPNVAEADPAMGIPPAPEATPAPLAAPDYDGIVDALQREGALALASPAPASVGASPTDPALAGASVAPPDSATAPASGATPDPALSPTSGASPDPTPALTSGATPDPAPDPSPSAPAPAALPPTPTPRPTPGFSASVPLPAYDTARYAWSHSGPYEGAPVIPGLDMFWPQPPAAFDGLLDAGATGLGSTLIVAGGRRDPGGDPVAAVWAAEVDADGNLGAAVRRADLAIAVARPALLVTGAYLYVFGGEAAGGHTGAIQRSALNGGALGPFEIAGTMPVPVWPPVVAASGSLVVAAGEAGAVALSRQPDATLGAPAGLALRTDGRTASFAGFAGSWFFLGGGGTGDYLVADVADDPAELACFRWPEAQAGPTAGRAVADASRIWIVPEGTPAEVSVVGLGSRGPTDEIPTGRVLGFPRERQVAAVAGGRLWVLGGTGGRPPEGALILAP